MADSPVHELRPERFPFLLPRLLAGFLPSLVVGGTGVSVGLVAKEPVLAAVAGLFAVLGGGLAVASARAAYRKERYRLLPDRIEAQRGGLLSDQRTALEVRNVTHVKLRLPWLRHKLFGVGEVRVESAGSADSEVVLRAVAEPEAVYRAVVELMRAAGYSLAKRELIHEERPDLVGVLLECAGLFATGALAVFWAAADIVAELNDEVSDWSWVWGAALLLAPLLALVGLTALAVHFLDLRRRTYRVYDDVVVYEEGFLTRHDAFIPYENIADANTKQNLLDQLLGLYDVRISCQGSGSEISFRRLRRGPDLRAAVQRLVAAAQERARGGERPPSERLQGAGGAPGLAPGSWVAPPAEAWTAELRMHPARTLAPALCLVPLLPLGLAALLKAAIELLAVRFSVLPAGVARSYSFLSSEVREFAYDKVTGVEVLSNPWDRLFATATVRLWSIGAAQPIELRNVRRADLDLEALLRQAGIPAPSPEPLDVPARFSLGVALRAGLPLLVLGVGLAAALLAGAALHHPAVAVGLVPLGLAFGGGLFYRRAYCARQRLRFHAGHVELRAGLFFRRWSMAPHRWVKRVVSVRYPGGPQGRLRLFVAGERRVEGKKKGEAQAVALLPFELDAVYVPDVVALARTADAIIGGEVAAAPGVAAPRPSAPQDVATRAAAASVLRTLLVGVLVPPLWPLLPLLLPWAAVRARRFRYVLDVRGVRSRWGVLYRTQSSVRYDRIDSLRHGQGPLQKLCRCGDVVVLTAGSSQPDLVLSDVRQHRTLYQALDARYAAGGLRGGPTPNDAQEGGVSLDEVASTGYLPPPETTKEEA